MELVAILGLVSVSGFAGCSSNAPNEGTPDAGTSTKKPSSSSSGSSSGSGVSGSSGSSGTSSGVPGSSGDDTLGSSSDDASPSGDDAEAGEGGDDAGDDGGPTPEGGPTSDGGPETPDSTLPPPSCVKGQVPPNKVVMIGDSYLDYPAWSNVAPDLFTDARNAGSLGANAQYREYQLGGAAMNYGTLNLNIPYQYETTAKGDVAYTNPADIDTIIMDGGGNDVIIDNQECLTSSTAPTGSDACSMAIEGTLNRAQTLLAEMSTDGVKHIVYFFYPHLDPAGGGLLPTPSPEVNVTLDYAYPKAAQICCGTPFTGTATNYACSGLVNGTQCVFIDTRPAFEGHIADYIKPDHVHPTPAGAQVIADLIWGAMTNYCIAQ
jgi:hypothetical protein